MRNKTSNLHVLAVCAGVSIHSYADRIDETDGNSPMMLPCGEYSQTKYLARPKLGSKMPLHSCTAQPTVVVAFQTT